jgi:hypothetical protein
MIGGLLSDASEAPHSSSMPIHPNDRFTIISSGTDSDLGGAHLLLPVDPLSNESTRTNDDGTRRPIPSFKTTVDCRMRGLSNVASQATHSLNITIHMRDRTTIISSGTDSDLGGDCFLSSVNLISHANTRTLDDGTRRLIPSFPIMVDCRMSRTQSNAFYQAASANTGPGCPTKTVFMPTRAHRPDRDEDRRMRTTDDVSIRQKPGLKIMVYCRVQSLFKPNVKEKETNDKAATTDSDIHLTSSKMDSVIGGDCCISLLNPFSFSNIQKLDDDTHDSLPPCKIMVDCQITSSNALYDAASPQNGPKNPSIETKGRRPNHGLNRDM